MAARVSLGEITLAYEDTGGDGPTVLFLHGLGGSSNCWLAQLRSCRRRGWRGIALDQRGAGRSEAPAPRYSLEGWASDAAGALDALDIGRTALVGHSVGCMIALRAAQLLGRRAWALALCGGTASWPEAAAAAFAERARLARAGHTDEIAEAVAASGLSEACRRRDPRLLGLMREMIAANDGDSYARWAEATGEASMEGIEDLQVPLLAFCGSEDPVTPPAAAQRIAAAASGGHFALVEGAAHWCMLEDPDGTDAALFPFLQEHSPGE